MALRWFQSLGSVLLLGVCLVLGSPIFVTAQEIGYITEVQDLPLMPGLEEVEGAGVTFDKPSGRIVEAYAQGPVTRAAVVAFYAETLPQLGWERRGEARFMREGESLSLEFLDEGDLLTLRFTLKPE